VKWNISINVFLLAYLFAVAAWAQQDERVDVGLFSLNDTSGWEIRNFTGATDYSLTRIDGKQVVVARSRQSASAFYKKIDINLDKTPILNWSWRKEQPIDPGDELDKKGDDYVARIYVVKSSGMILSETIALNYVWSYQHHRNDIWNNPIAGENSKMLAQRDASDPQGTWFNERRNVVLDFKRLHGKDIHRIDGVAIMTDSDNSGLNATALYGDIFFSSAGQ
jgi:hypothetical protein